MIQPSQKKMLIKIAGSFYGTGIAAFGIQQLMYADFRPVILPPSWPSWMHAYGILAYIFGTALIAAGVYILFGKKTRTVSLILGGGLFVFFIGLQCPYIIFVQPNLPYHLALWTDPLKELALSGGAFVMAGLYKNRLNTAPKNYFFNVLEKFIPFGRIFFCTTMISFGIDHFFYTDFVADLVPAWVPDHTIWTYFAGVALITSGVAIILEIRTERVALLLSLMLFLWVILLHIPRSIAQPFIDNGNEITSAFEALAFSGIALGIACLYKAVNKGGKIQAQEA